MYNAISVCGLEFFFLLLINFISFIQQQRLVHLEEKVHHLNQSRDEIQNRCTVQTQTITELQGKNNKHTFENESLKRRIEELNQVLRILIQWHILIPSGRYH